VGTSGSEFQKALTGKKVIDAGQQGKYFWMIMSSPPHPVMHFGMSGWLKYKNEHTYYYQPKAGEKKEEWPPKYWKFILETEEEPKVEAAFVDLRRFGRIRLVDCKAEEIRKVSPLVENGPDPVIDKDIVTEEWLLKKCRAKKVPIKAMLLDQANISGIGNWVGDEIMYHAKMHPEQYANTLSDEQIKQLHKSIHYICSTSVELLGDSEKFPEDWLFKHRWGKGKKDAPKTMPNGEKITFLVVGGRTSAVVPSVQKKTGPVAKEMSESEVPEDEEDSKPKKAAGKKKSPVKEQDESEAHPTNETKSRISSMSGKRKSAAEEEDEDEDVRVNRTAAKSRKSKFKEELEDEESKSEPAKAAANQGKKRKSAGKDGVEPTPNGTASKRKKQEENLVGETAGRRRSGRVSKS
jgi:formamidopyrimidine-DNA glycosylase